MEKWRVLDSLLHVTKTESLITIRALIIVTTQIQLQPLIVIISLYWNWTRLKKLIAHHLTTTHRNFIIIYI